MPTNVRTTLQARVTKTAAFAGAALDVSGFTGDFAIKLKVWSLTAGNNVRFVLEESGDSFVTVLPSGNGLTIQGVSPEGDVVGWKRRDLGNLTKFGVASGKVRLNLTQIDGGTVDFESWIIS